MLSGVSADSMQACAHCGRLQERLFPRERVGQVCSSCYESLGRLRPEWSRMEILGVLGLLVGSGLLVVAVIALLVR